MSSKSLVYLGAGVGGFFGSLIPLLWGAGFLSLWGVIFEAIGGLAGIYITWRLING
jgi:hypothetical protein